MDADALSQALRHSAFAADFPAEVTQALADAARWRSFAAGTVIFREGERCSAFYIVHRGHVALDMSLAAHGGTRLITLGPGEVVAWSALVGDGRMTATAAAADEVELIEFPGAEVLKRCEADPQFGYHLMRRLAAALAKRLLATRLQMLDLFRADATPADGGLR
jgi:CRP/FNR family cyclic AMP-dependent transcriptional regulator